MTATPPAGPILDPGGPVEPVTPPDGLRLPAVRSSGAGGRAGPVAAMERELLIWRSGAAVLGGCVLLGVLQALLWSVIAPAQRFQVYKDGSYAPLPTESQHRFVAIAMFLLIAVVVGVTVAVAAWAWRSTRGLAMLLSLGLANAVGALTAYLLGPVFAGGVDPVTVGASNAITVVSAPPESGSALLLVIQPGLALAIYTILAAWSGLPDLGRSDSAIPDGPAAPPMS